MCVTSAWEPENLQGHAKSVRGVADTRGNGETREPYFFLFLVKMVDSNKFSELSLLSVSDQGATNRETPPIADDNKEPEAPTNPQLAGSPEPPPLLDPSLRRGRNQPGSRPPVVANQTRKAASRSKFGGQFNSTRAAAPKPPTTNLSLLIFTAVATCQKKSGLSMQALKKIVTNMGYDMAKKKHYFLRSIKGMVAKGQLWQVKGTGATGSFKVNPDMGKKKSQPKVKGRGRQAKEAGKKKRTVATSRGSGQTKTKKPVKEPSKATKRNKIPSLPASQTQVKV